MVGQGHRLPGNIMAAISQWENKKDLRELGLGGR